MTEELVRMAGNWLPHGCVNAATTPVLNDCGVFVPLPHVFLLATVLFRFCVSLYVLGDLVCSSFGCFGLLQGSLGYAQVVSAEGPGLAGTCLRGPFVFMHSFLTNPAPSPPLLFPPSNLSGSPEH